MTSLVLYRDEHGRLSEQELADAWEFLQAVDELYAPKSDPEPTPTLSVSCGRKAAASTSTPGERRGRSKGGRR
jgi:hypothetical protein